MALEMISLKSQREIEAMRRAGRLTAQARALAGSMVRPGVTTHEIDRAVRRFIESHGAKPSFLGYGGFPGSACISVNEVVIHGIPGPYKLREGDIVSIDVGAFIGGFHGDCAATYPCGQVSEEAMRLIQVTQQSFWEGIKNARRGCRVSDIGHAVQVYVERNGFSVVREYVGHGVGAKMHESPEIPNFGRPGHGPRLLRGMTLAIEPMVNAGAAAITTSCGFLAMFQRELAARVSIPVFASSLLQVRLVSGTLAAGKQVGIMTADSRNLGQRHFRGVGIEEIPRVVCGMEGTHFHDVFVGNSPRLDRELARQNIRTVAGFLAHHRLSDDWYDVVIFRYLLTVQNWLDRPELHRYAFSTIAWRAMSSAVSNERRKQGRRIRAVSLDAPVPGADGITLGDTVTADNLYYIPYQMEAS